MARRGRKHNATLLIASQFIDEFLNSEEGKTIINICSTRFLFKQSSGNVDEIQEFFNLSDGAKELLTSASPGECIMSLNNNITAISFEVAPYEKEFVFT